MCKGVKVNKIHDGKNTKCYKIGYTSNLEERMTTYRTGNPDIELVHHENIKCNKKQLEKCILSLNILKLLHLCTFKMPFFFCF